MTDEAIDEVIFDYLEGNLSAEEKEAFEVILNESEVTSYQVKLWQKTYVEEALPSVEMLEKRLLRPAAETVVTAVSFWQKLFMVLVIVSTAAVFQEFQDHTDSDSKLLSPVKNIDQTFLNENPTNVPEECTSFVVKRVVKAPADIKPEVHSEIVAPLSSVVLNSANINTLALKSISMDVPYKADFNLVEAGSKVSRITSVRKYTGAERRSIRKKKRKEEERRMATEFMKGNVPYVVPLKSNNF
jgi:hypothetical protein